MKKSNASLHIHGLELNVNLGWTLAERKKKQKVWLDLYVRFPRTPKACTTDNLNDTVCYDDLTRQLQIALAKHSFRLIERLAYDIYQLVKVMLPKKTLVSVSLTKHPKIKKLRGNVCFHYGDE